MTGPSSPGRRCRSFCGEASQGRMIMMRLQDRTGDLGSGRDAGSSVYRCVFQILDIAQLADRDSLVYIAECVARLADDLSSALCPGGREHLRHLVNSVRVPVLASAQGAIADSASWNTFLVRSNAYQLVRRIYKLAQRIDPDELEFIAWRAEQISNDLCFAVSDAGREQHRRLAAGRRAPLVGYDGVAPDVPRRRVLMTLRKAA